MRISSEVLRRTLLHPRLNDGDDDDNDDGDDEYDGSDEGDVLGFLFLS